MEGWEIVFRAQGLTEAELVQGYLETKGIPVHLDYESAGKALGITMDGMGEVRLRVPIEYAEIAHALIAKGTGRITPRERSADRPVERFVDPEELDDSDEPDVA